MRGILLAVALCAVLPARAGENISDLLKRQTQELFDAVSHGDARVWEKYLDAGVLVTDESGIVTDKAQTVAQVVPLPKGISGTITVTDWRLALHGDIAVAAYVEDEREDFHGQHLHALYRSTTTWVKEPSGWKMIAQQTIALRQDPPAVTLPAAELDAYVGVYRAAPDLTYEIARKGGTLLGGTVGGKAVPMAFELRDVAFVAGQPRTRKIFQRDAHGRVVGFLSRREERDVVWTRIR